MNEEIKIEGLTPEERQHLAMQAHYQSQNWVDPRYHLDRPRAGRQALRDRWQQIADALYPNPWGIGDRSGQ